MKKKMCHQRLMPVSGQDLITADVDIIVQQCNCITTNSYGLSDYISKKLDINIYGMRRSMNNRKTLAIFEDRCIPGSCWIVPNSQTSRPRYVACLLAQFSPGQPQKFYQDVVREHGLQDDANQRLEWFRQSLDNLKIQMKPLDIKTIAFPKFIGCGLAGGDFKTYQKVLEEFVATLDDNIKVYIISLP